MDQSPKYLLITGCSSGIGYMAATELAKLGYQVIASCRNKKDVLLLQQQGIDCIHLDLADLESIDRAIEQCLALTHGQLYAVIHNGAFAVPGAIEDLPTEALRYQLDTNLLGWHHLTRGLIPLFRQQKHGRIILVSSVLGFAATKYRGAYNTSKYALEGWADTLRLELAPAGITVSLLQPGPIATQFRANALNQFNHWIEYRQSVHHQAYQQQIDRLSKTKSNNKYCLEPIACLAPLRHALESPRPKIRYRITTPTKIMAVLKRLLPGRWIDKILARSV